MIQRKTAKLFEAAAQAGRRPRRGAARAARTRSPATACTWAPRSSWSTTSSTIRARAESIGKNLGDDLAEGKMTLPLIRAMPTGSRRGRGADPARDRRRRPDRLRAGGRGAGAHRRARLRQGLRRRRGPARRDVPGRTCRFCVPPKSARIDDLRGATNVLRRRTVRTAGAAASRTVVAGSRRGIRRSVTAAIRGVA